MRWYRFSSMENKSWLLETEKSLTITTTVSDLFASEPTKPGGRTLEGQWKALQYIRREFDVPIIQNNHCWYYAWKWVQFDANQAYPIIEDYPEEHFITFAVPNGYSLPISFAVEFRTQIDRKSKFILKYNISTEHITIINRYRNEELYAASTYLPTVFDTFAMEDIL